MCKCQMLKCQMLQCLNAKCSNGQMVKCQMHKCLNTKCAHAKCSNAQMPTKCTNTQMLRPSNAQFAQTPKQHTFTTHTHDTHLLFPHTRRVVVQDTVHGWDDLFGQKFQKVFRTTSNKFAQTSQRRASNTVLSMAHIGQKWIHERAQVQVHVLREQRGQLCGTCIACNQQRVVFRVIFCAFFSYNFRGKKGGEERLQCVVLHAFLCIFWWQESPVVCILHATNNVLFFVCFFVLFFFVQIWWQER